MIFMWWDWFQAQNQQKIDFLHFFAFFAVFTFFSNRTEDYSKTAYPIALRFWHNFPIVLGCAMTDFILRYINFFWSYAFLLCLISDFSWKFQTFLETNNREYCFKKKIDNSLHAACYYLKNREQILAQTDNFSSRNHPYHFMLT